ncbi:MAG: histidine kinase, partial [Prevotella sp.]|nr:histidine kinase [Prevotella sp.]
MAACNDLDTDKSDNNISLYYQSTDSLNNRNLAFAEKTLRQLDKTADQDSNIYYLSQCLKGKMAFINNDTEVINNVRTLLKNFLKRNNSSHNEIKDVIRVEYYSIEGLYWIKCVGNTDSTYKYFNKAYMLAKNTKSIPNSSMVNIIINLADTYKQTGHYDQAIIYYIEAAKKAQREKQNYNNVIAIYMGISIAYTSMGDFKMSEKWWDKSGQYWSHMNSNDRFIYLNNRGHDYYQRKQFERSRYYLEKADSMLSDKPEDEWNKMFVRVNLSDVYIQLGMYDKAEAMIHVTEAYFQKQKYLIPLHYLKTQRMTLDQKRRGVPSENYLSERLIADDLDNVTGVTELKRLRLQALINHYAEIGDCRRLYSAGETLRILDDSLRNNNMRMRFTTLVKDYEHDRRLLQQQRQIERHKQNFIITAMSVVFLLMFIIVSTLVLLLKRRQRKIKETKLLKKLMVMRMEIVRGRITPHFIGNSLNIAMNDQMAGKPIDLTPLVKLLRMSTETADTLFVSLDTELQFIDYYVTVMSSSLGPDFKYNKNIERDMDTTH